MLCVAHLAEAKLEEVLDSLRLRIRSLFTWAKSEVAGFDDLSPLDQKALLRRTVPELVMLGFARGSIAYNGVCMFFCVRVCVWCVCVCVSVCVCFIHPTWVSISAKKNVPLAV